MVGGDMGQTEWIWQGVFETSGSACYEQKNGFILNQIPSNNKRTWPCTCTMLGSIDAFMSLINRLNNSTCDAQIPPGEMIPAGWGRLQFRVWYQKSFSV